MDTLEKAHEENERAFPFAYICHLWNELWAVWIEELRESRRHLTRRLNSENPRKAELKCLALMPGAEGSPAFSFPSTFDLDDPAGYYQQVCLPKQKRGLDNLLCDLTYKQLGLPNKAGETEEPGGLPGLQILSNTEDAKTGGGDLPPPKKEHSGPARAYPAGQRLTAAESALSVKYAPIDPKSGKPICWDFGTHTGCARGASCPHAHQPLPSQDSMHWTVLSQVLRRGGTKNGRPVEPSSIDGRIQQLRDQAQDTEDKEGPLIVEIDEGHAGELPADGWTPPGEYGCFCCTQLENSCRKP